MPLARPSTQSAQPTPAPKPAMQDHTEAATAEDTTPGATFDHAAQQDHLPASATGGALAPQTPKGGSGQTGDFDSVSGELGFGSFPQIKLDKDKFLAGNDQKNEMDEFLFRPMSSKARFIYKAEKDSKDFFFSYDDTLANDGTPIANKLADWRAAGFTRPEKRKYQEVYGYIVESGGNDYEGRMVILSVPPASAPRFAAYMAELSLRRYEGQPVDGAGRPVPLGAHETICRIQKGAKITTKDANTFYPWDFQFEMTLKDWEAKEAEKLGAE